MALSKDEKLSTSYPFKFHDASGEMIYRKSVILYLKRIPQRADEIERAKMRKWPEGFRPIYIK